MKGSEVTTLAMVSPACLSPAHGKTVRFYILTSDNSYVGAANLDALPHDILQWTGFKNEGLCCHNLLQLQQRYKNVRLSNQRRCAVPELGFRIRDCRVLHNGRPDGLIVVAAAA
uniref:Uncharacterized protein n=1 Tax=Oryza punctata TaxID=4537 RepID=A0A0E0M139_ORYPU